MSIKGVQKAGNKSNRMNVFYIKAIIRNKHDILIAKFYTY